MRFSYGGYSWAANSVTINSTTTPVLEDGRPLMYTIRHDVEGCLEADGQAACAAIETAMRTALGRPYQDAVLRLDSGADSPVKLQNSASISGVRVVAGPVFDNRYGGAEYATARGFQVSFEATFIPPSAVNSLVSWKETVIITGTGGPEYSWRRPVNARPIRQIVRPFSTVRATQTGIAVGLTRYPVPPAPLWPLYEMVHLRRVRQLETPERVGQGFIRFPCAWGYEFEADIPLIGLPSIPLL